MIVVTENTEPFLKTSTRAYAFDYYGSRLTHSYSMRKTRGFRLQGRKLVKIFKWIIRPRRNVTRYHRLGHPTRTRTFNPMSKILSLAQCLQRGAKRLCFPKPQPDYIRLGQDPVETRKPAGVPKGYLAVYVGDSDDDTQRYLVPVIYFNHPLFGELLQEAEKVFGFNHPGGITIPCGVSEFEKVQTRIASGGTPQRRLSLPPLRW